MWADDGDYFVRAFAVVAAVIFAALTALFVWAHSVKAVIFGITWCVPMVAIGLRAHRRLKKKAAMPPVKPPPRGRDWMGNPIE